MPADEKKAAEAKKEEPKKEGETKKKDDKKKDDDEELSEEDQAIQAQMELLVTRTSDPEPSLRLTALEAMVNEVRTSTSSMTSVPKPLKFLRPHYGTLKTNYEVAAAGPAKTLLADVLSMLAMTMGEDGKRESLNFKLLGSREDLGSWGHEFVRHLAGEIGAEFNERLSKQEAAEAAKAAAAKAEAADGDVAIVEAEAGEPKDPAELMPLILAQITPFFMKHNAEAEAIDLLMEVSRLDELVAHVDKTNCDRICAYLSQLSMYVPEPEDSMVLTVAVNSLRKLDRFPEALMMAVRLQDDALLEEILTSCETPSSRSRWRTCSRVSAAGRRRRKSSRG